MDPFEIGARNAVRVCLRVQPGERVTVITDRETAPIAEALAEQLRAGGAGYRVWVLEDESQRPLTEMPRAILDDLESAQVSIFCAQAKTGELPSRMQMTEVVNRRRIRHAHMVNITPEIMMHGMRADYDAVDRLSLKLLEMARQAKVVRATTPAECTSRRG